MTSTTASARSSTTTLAPVPLNPVTPLLSSRYDPVKKLPRGKWQTKLPAGPLNATKGELDKYMYGLGDLPPGWERYIHLDGKLYFRHPGWRIVTEAYILDPTTLSRLEDWYRLVSGLYSTKFPQAPLSQQQELYLSLDPKPAYYIADHDIQTVFWLEELSISKLGLNENTQNSSFELFIERNYYRHLENFPVHNTLPTKAVSMLRGALTHACTEHMTSRESSTAPWNAADCKTYLELVQALEEDGPGVDSSYKTWLVARLLCNMLHSRWAHRYGLYDARTDRLASLQIARASHPLSGFLDFIGNILFFHAHHTYAERLEEAWADRIVSLTDWHRLVTSLLVEWSDSNLLATVILSANVAFLALTDITEVERAGSIISTLFAIGSIVVGLHHVWRHRVKADTDAQQAGAYFRNATSAMRSLKLLAFFLSLPLILLSWSLVAFVFSIIMYAFYNHRPWPSYIAVGAVVVTIVTVVASTVLFFSRIFGQRGRLQSVQRTWWSMITRIRRGKRISGIP